METLLLLCLRNIGGGFVFGDLTSDASFLEKMQKDFPIVILDVDYRLCPGMTPNLVLENSSLTVFKTENRFDQAVEDAWIALQWTHQNAMEVNGDPASISISGISAGGHLAALMQHLARDAGIPLRLAILTVPCTDYTTYWPTPEGYNLFPSVERLKNTAMLDAARIEYFHELVNNERDREHLATKVPQWWKTPLRSDNFKDLCDTFIATAECDALVDEGEAYGKKIVEAGGLVMFRRYIGQPHPFTHLPLRAAHQYDADVFKALKMAHRI